MWISYIGFNSLNTHILSLRLVMFVGILKWLKHYK